MTTDEELFMNCSKTMKKTEVATKEFDIARPKFQLFMALDNPNCQTENKKAVKKTEMSEFKFETGSNGSLMLMRMYKMLFPKTNINELNKFTNKKVLHAYNIS